MQNIEPIKYKTYENELLFNLEWDIIKEKIAQGVNGIEWLVMTILTEQHVKDSHYIWNMRIGCENVADSDQATIQIAINNFLLSSDEFYKEHSCNWWISTKHAIYYLQMLKKNDYTRYLKFLQLYEESQLKRRTENEN